MQMVYHARSLAEAQAVAELLQRKGIESHIPSPTAAPQLSGDQFVQVLVNNRRLDAARRVIAAWRRLGSEPR